MTDPTASRVALTGAGGSLGSMVLRHLLRAGFDVRASLGPPGEAPRRSPPPGAHALYVDIRDPVALEGLLDGCSAVVHVAGPPAVGASFDQPAAFASAHVFGTATVAETAIRCGVQRLIYISSAEVYGGGLVGEDAPLQPRSPYAACKCGAEQLLRTLSHQLQTVVLRPFLIADTLPQRGVFRVIERQLDAPVIGLLDPDVVRDLVWVDDVAELVVRATTHPISHRWRVYNAGSGRGLRIGELASALHRRAGGSGEVVRVPGQPRHQEPLGELIADIGRAERELGWRPRVKQTELIERLSDALAEEA